MKHISLFLLFIMASLLSSCKDDTDDQPIVDVQGPEINARWIDHPSIANDPTGPISNGGNYAISIQAGFQFLLDVKDASTITNGSVYFLVNDDPGLRENVVYEEAELGYDEGSISFIYRVDNISLGEGNFYTIQPGDRYHFYATFSDEHTNTSNMSWTADLID